MLSNEVDTGHKITHTNRSKGVKELLKQRKLFIYRCFFQHLSKEGEKRITKENERTNYVVLLRF